MSQLCHYLGNTILTLPANQDNYDIVVKVLICYECKRVNIFPDICPQKTVAFIIKTEI